VRLLSFSNPRHVGWVSPRLELPTELLYEPEAAFRLPETDVILDCDSRKILRVRLAVDGRQDPCFLYIFANHSLGRAIRSTYAFHILRMARSLRQAGFGTLQVLAAFRPRRQWLNWRSYLIAREIHPVLELPSGGRHRYPVHDSAELGLDLLTAVAYTLAEFHNQGFIHGDLKTRHVLAHRNGNEPGSRFPWDIILVDLEKTRRLPRLLGRIHDIYAARDLVQLCASLPETHRDWSLTSLKRELVARYLEFRSLPASRARNIRAIIDLYRPGGVLRQGRTLLDSAFSRLWSP
jgi:hypothetical protein